MLRAWIISVLDCTSVGGRFAENRGMDKTSGRCFLPVIDPARARRVSPGSVSAQRQLDGSSRLVGCASGRVHLLPRRLLACDRRQREHEVGGELGDLCRVALLMHQMPATRDFNEAGVRHFARQVGR